MYKACESSHGGQTGVRLSCLAAKGFQFTTTYQPDSHYWRLQGIETAILLTAACLLMGAGAWWAIRRIS